MTATRTAREAPSEALLVLLRRVCSVFGPKRLALPCKPGDELHKGLYLCTVHYTVYLPREYPQCVCQRPEHLGLIDLASATGLAPSTLQEALAGRPLHPKTLERIEAGCRSMLTTGSGLRLIKGGKS